MDSIIYIIIVFSTYAFLGWIFEVILIGIKSKKIVNRGFLFGPFLPIYGVGALTVLVLYNLMEVYDKVYLLILGSTMVVSFIELITGLLLEKIFHARWWDYSDLRFNYKGHISLIFSSIWGVFAYLIIRFIQPTINHKINGVKPSLLIMVASLLFIYLLIDVILSIGIVTDLSKIIKRHPTLDKLREQLMHKPFHFHMFNKHFKAFPKLKFHQYPNLHIDLKYIFDNAHTHVTNKIKKKK